MRLVGVSIFKEKTGKKGCINSDLCSGIIMVYNKKVTTYIVIILLVIWFIISLSHSNKPSKEVMINIIFRLKVKDLYNLNNDIEVKNSDLKPNRFNILNEFVSKHNGRYCIIVDYELEYSEKGEKTLYVGSNEHYSFEKKGNQWYGWKGWGPGE